MQAAELFEQKIKPLEVARHLRVSPKSAYHWHQLWRDGGLQAPASRGPSRIAVSSVPALSGEAGAYLEQGPAVHGWAEDQVWTAARVAPLIGQEVPRLLQRLRGDEADAPARLQPAVPRAAGR
ncbi:helix-turn-helix domain-containing protein [Streptomyces sp. NPDC058476]|uniref:helix-turn-helix domain-containing protein n=1 Tax=Streptomyces sp. NPDC058476 TaxID=3346519 RepID=UPI003647E158